MSENELKAVADNAAIIVSGFAYTITDNKMIRVLNLESPMQACVLDIDGNMIETTMDDATLCMVQAYYLKNKTFMEE